MPPLRRHQLAYLSAEGWRDVLDRDWDADARACLSIWSQRHLPLVVTRQRVPRECADAPVSLGLSAPAAFDRRLFALQVAPARISWFREFPRIDEALSLVPPRARPTIEALGRELAGLGVKAHAYGSLGWQFMTGMSYLHRRSDLDVWVGVDDAVQADAAARAMQRLAPADPRLDGELVFVDGAAVAWREWLAWREGACRALLVKRLDGAAIEASFQDAFPERVAA